MDLSKSGAQFLMGLEGFVPHWYPDSGGVGTIGIGFTWRSQAFRKWWEANKSGQPFRKGATITREEAEAALIEICHEEYGHAVEVFLDKVVPQHVFDAMTSVVYNLGPGALHWKWAAAVKRGDYSKAASLLRTTGITVHGRRLMGLVIRRRKEAGLLAYGTYGGEIPISGPMEDSMLVRGERGPAVAALIKDLATLGYYDGVMDDVFGVGTERAVLEFQKDHGLVPDGYAGPKTLKAIQKAVKAEAIVPQSVLPLESPPMVEDPAPILPVAGASVVGGVVAGYVGVDWSLVIAAVAAIIIGALVVRAFTKEK